MKEIIALTNSIVNQIRRLFCRLFCDFDSSRDPSLDEIETEVRSVMLEIGRQTMEAIIRERGTGYSEKQIQPPSGSIGEYREDRTRTIKTLMGPIEINRAYYHLGKGKGGYVPLNASLFLPQEQFHRSNSTGAILIRSSGANEFVCYRRQL